MDGDAATPVIEVEHLTVEFQLGRRHGILLKQRLANLFGRKVELQPVGNNLRYFLEMSGEVGAPFVAYGKLTDTLPWEDGTEEDRGSSTIIGPFHVDWLRFGSDIIVQNII